MRQRKYLRFRLTSPYSLDALCKAMDVDKGSLVAKLKAAGFQYSEQYNKFW